MKIAKIFRQKKAVSAVIATMFMLGLTAAAIGIVFGMLNGYSNFNANVQEAGIIEVFDYDHDGMIDTISMPFINTGMTDANVITVKLIQNGDSYLWYTIDRTISIGSYETIYLYALGINEQIAPFLPFHVEITFEKQNFISSAYVATIASEVPNEILPFIISGESGINFQGFDLLASRTADDDVHGKKKFPTTTGYSPTFWFLLGKFDENNKKASVNVDYIELSGYGNELAYQPYLLDDTTFNDGPIGYQSGYKVMPYKDAGEHPGLLAIDKYGNWDKDDNINWNKGGVVYMWSYVYVTGTETQTVSIGANGASEFQVYLNGEFQVNGNNKNNWYTKNGVTLNPGLNLILMKVSAVTNAHFAGQVLFFNNVNLANFYSVWPTLNDL